MSINYFYTATDADDLQVNVREISVSLFQDTLLSVFESEIFKVNLATNKIVCKILENELIFHDDPFKEIVEQGVDIEPELSEIDRLVSEIIASIDSHLRDLLTFQEMWEIDKKHARHEICRAIGYGTSFWWNNDYHDFGFDDMPRIEYFDSPRPQTQAILGKFITYIQQQLA